MKFSLRLWAEPPPKLMTSASLRRHRLFRIRGGLFMAIIFVGLGGFVGACARYLLCGALAAALPHFPYGTLLSNIIAGFLIGFIIGLERQAPTLSVHAKLFLTTGLMGGLSTFSAFSMETVSMIEKGTYALAGANILLNVGLGLLCAFAGLMAARLVRAEA
jgi:CrcB protein